MTLSKAISDIDYKVKDAIAVWVEWMQIGDSGKLGFGRCVGFDAAGGNVSGWDDFERRVNKNMAINVQAIYEGLSKSQQIAIDHYHLAAVWISNRTNIEDDYKSAIESLTAGLKRRGLI